MLTDSHWHPDDSKYDADLDAVVERAAAAGVGRMLAIGTGDGPPELDRAIRIAERYPQVFATVGVHPHDAAKVTPETIPHLRELARHPKVVAVGEIGLDYHYNFSPRDQQRQVFLDQLELAAELGLPISIHTRDAWEDTVAILGDSWRGEGILHCFSGDAMQARQALDLNFHLAFGGVITYKTADNVREAAAVTPDDRLLIETDAPWLAPLPWRGKRNEPAYMTETVRRLAELRGTTPDHIAQVTSANFERLCLFGPETGGLHSGKGNRYTEISHEN